ncbi:MAG: hypothetical protein ACT4PM_02870 [Gemmatimonadales bacterium]
MVVSLRRAGFGALVLAALLLPLRRSPRPSPAETTRSFRQRTQDIRQRLAVALNRWSALEQRDTALAVLTRHGPTGLAPHIWLSGFPAGAKPMETERALLQEIWTRIAPLDSTVRVALLAYEPRRYENASWGRAYSGNLVRKVDGLTWCVAILPASTRPDGSVQIHRWSLAWGAAPCALLAAFGPPGPMMQRWLEATRLVGARSLAWSGLTALYDVGESPWTPLPVPNPVALPRVRRVPVLQAILGPEVAELRSPPYWFGAPGVRCLVGHQSSCTDAVLRSGVMSAAEDGLPEDLLSRNRFLLEIPGITLATARPVGGTYLSDLIQREGRERFRQFWRSDQPFEAAFQAGFGRSVGEWTAGWARARWLGMYETRYGNSEIALGVTFAPDWIPLALAWTGIALLWAGAAARRRDVS